MIDTAEDRLLFIEPTNPAATEPCMDSLAYAMMKAMEQGHTGGPRYRGWHTCVCGEHSDNQDHFVTTADGKKLMTHSLAVHYLVYHRNEIPEGEMKKVRMLPEAA